MYNSLKMFWICKPNCRLYRRSETFFGPKWYSRYNKTLAINSIRKYCSTSGEHNKTRRLSPEKLAWVLGASLFGTISYYVFHSTTTTVFNEENGTSDRFVMPNSKKLVLFKRKGHWIPHDFIGSDKQLEEVKNFRVRDDDIFVASFPKSGTTWVQEIVYQIANIDYPDESLRFIDDRFPYLEFAYPGIKELNKMTNQRRFIKTHVQLEALPSDILDGKGKVIYVARNVKDVTVSMFHFYKLISNVSYTGPFSEFCEIFNSGKVAYGPYWKHVGDYWSKRELENFLFISYEDLQKDVISEIKKIADFIGKKIDDKQARDIAAKSSFKYMKRNPYTNYNWYKTYGMLKKTGSFMRKGEVGDWRNYYTAELCEQTDALTKEHFEPLGLHLVDALS